MCKIDFCQRVSSFWESNLHSANKRSNKITSGIRLWVLQLHCFFCGRRRQWCSEWTRAFLESHRDGQLIVADPWLLALLLEISILPNSQPKSYQLEIWVKESVRPLSTKKYIFSKKFWRFFGGSLLRDDLATWWATDCLCGGCLHRWHLDPGHHCLSRPRHIFWQVGFWNFLNCGYFPPGNRPDILLAYNLCQLNPAWCNFTNNFQSW